MATQTTFSEALKRAKSDGAELQILVPLPMLEDEEALICTPMSEHEAHYMAQKEEDIPVEYNGDPENGVHQVFVLNNL